MSQRKISTSRCRVFAIAVVAAGLASPLVAQPAPEPAALAAIWDAEHVSPTPSPLLQHAELVERLHAVRAATPDLFSLEEIGESVERRSINHLWFGTGPLHVLLWSQMHGDEPTATSALLDFYEYVRRRRDDPPVRQMLDALTIHTVPMLNPDGAARFQRRNAQGIDINRDALRLQTPEGRALKTLRDRLDPPVGFNLHNQNWRTSVGTSPRPATISLLSVAYDEARSVNDGRLLTKKIAAVIREAIEPFTAGQIGRYDDSFEVRAFGDNLTLWGTHVVLIETGPWPAVEPDPPLVRINFVALVSALDALATGRVHEADPARYESLLMNESMIFYELVTNARIVSGTGAPPFIGDVGLNAARSVEAGDGTPWVRIRSTIQDIGDLRVYGALTPIDATGLTLTPVFEDAEVGAVLALPDWTVEPSERTVSIGEPGDLLLLRDQADGRYRVERVLRSERRIDRQ